MPERKLPELRSVRWILYLSIFGPFASGIMLVARWVYLHKNEPDFSLLLVNYTVAWLPFAFSIFIAFVPDMRKLHKFWRGLVILGGLSYSVILFKQQVLTMEASRRDQQSAIENAVKLSNDHSDKQIEFVRNDVKGVKDDVKNVKKDLGAQVSKSEITLSDNISKVGKPPVSVPAQLEASLYAPGPTPVLVGNSVQEQDRSFPIEFSFTNTTDVAAENIDIWIQVCDFCTFAAEPGGWLKPSGINEHVRNRMIPILNPGASFEKTKLLIKTTVSLPNFVDFAFRYSCKTCGKMRHDQIMRIYLEPTRPN